LKGSCCFCLYFCLYTVLHLRIYVCWNFLASLEWNWLIIDYDLFDMLLNFVCQYFVENLCVYIHERYWSLIPFFWLQLKWVLEWVYCWLHRMSLVVFLSLLFPGKVWVILILVLL
jgi:hypothetical protein